MSRQVIVRHLRNHPTPMKIRCIREDVTEQFSRGCANVIHSCKRILLSLHEFSHLYSHLVFEIAFAEAARLVRRVTPRSKDSSRCRRGDTTSANIGK